MAPDLRVIYNDFIQNLFSQEYDENHKPMFPIGVRDHMITRKNFWKTKYYWDTDLYYDYTADYDDILAHHVWSNYLRVRNYAPSWFCKDFKGACTIIIKYETDYIDDYTWCPDDWYNTDQYDIYEDNIDTYVIFNRGIKFNIYIENGEAYQYKNPESMQWFEIVGDLDRGILKQNLETSGLRDKKYLECLKGLQYILTNYNITYVSRRRKNYIQRKFEKTAMKVLTNATCYDIAETIVNKTRNKLN